MSRISLYKYWIAVLEKASPNGRYNHSRINAIQALRNAVNLGIELAPQYEREVKSLINKLYGDTYEHSTDSKRT